MRDFIKSKLDTRKAVYLKDPNIILEDYRKEKEKIDEYNGRQLLEMLQNADDEAITEKEKTCLIKLSENQLTIANNGQKFSEAGIESLMYGNLSPKLSEQNKVGQKGLGFRSILSWANKITIKSYDFAVEFSESNAKEFLKTLIAEKPEIESQLYEKEKNEKFPIATLRCPKIIEDIPQDLHQYDTYIVIDLKEHQISEVQNQINTEINKEVLLFLNNLEKIIVDSPSRYFEIQKEIIESKAIIREHDYRNDESIEKVWNIKAFKGLYNNKNYELKIAWNDNLDDNIGRLYSYFKTNVKFPFPALIHGTFDLTSDRNHFTPKSEHNIFLMNELIKLLIDTALEISKSEVSYKPLKLLSIQGKENFDTYFDDNGFRELLKNSIRKSKIYPTISEKYISYDTHPIFYNQNYAEILPAAIFPNLLLHTNDKNIKETLDWIGFYIYNEEFFFSTISRITEEFEIEKRAILISFLVSDFHKSDVSRDNLPNVFIDQGNQIIESSSEIFLPPSGVSIEIPLKLNLKIINYDLFARLKKIFGSENAEVIEDKLKLFGIKVYRFGDIFRRIVSFFNKNNDSSTYNLDSIKALLANLSELYKLNKDKEGIDISIPNNITIPILNRKNEVTTVSEVYLGNDYGNKLCELLYEYDKSKLVGSPKILGLEKHENISEFIQWLGVEKYPRKKIIVAEQDYGKFALMEYPYKEKNIYANDVTLDSFKKLEQKGYYVHEIKVETIDNLEHILRNNSNENILYWLNKDRRITELNESNSNCGITLYISNKKYNTYIRKDDMPSYILWKIKNTQWLETENGTKVKPSNCCLSKTITKDFSPFIEIPKIRHDIQLFKDEKITRDVLEYILSKIGVNKEISDFSTDTIFSMLKGLHSIDNTGVKAKLIYRELAENLDEKRIDKNSKVYLSFIASGLVFCKKNGNTSFETAKNVYYVEDKTFGEDIINQFFTLEVDRRKGSKKIKTLFGVTPLENLKFTLYSEPILHPLNDPFQKEMDILKPYFYVFRLLKDTDGKELNWIKKSKITLCTKIDPFYEHNGQIKGFKLNPYEFIYIENKNEVYLLIDDGDKYKTLKDFQSDIKFPDCIAEIYSSILKVDLHRTTFLRLFEANTEKRIHIIKTELEDYSLEKLKTAKQKLNIVDDPKIQFWFSILSTVQKDYEFRKYQDDGFVSHLYSKLNLDINNFNINYESINDLTNFTVFIELFNELKIDIADFNRNSSVSLNIIPYYEYKLNQLRNDYQKRFDILLFQQLRNKEIDDKAKFLELSSKFETYNQYNLENSFKLDIYTLFAETIRNEFSIDMTHEEEPLALQEIYKNNFNNLFELLKPKNKNSLKEIIENNINYKSLIYFAEYEDILEEFKSLVKEDDDTKDILFNNRFLKVQKDDSEDLYHLILIHDPITEIVNIHSRKPVFSDDNDKTGKSKSHTKTQKSTPDKETLGFIGEIIAFESLKMKYGPDNVTWDSGFAKKANVNPNGDDSKHYDLKYKNHNGNWNFVEVKTTTSDRLEFKISNLEVKFGIENNSNYEIFVITNALDEKEKRRIKKFSNPFRFVKDESFTNNSKFKVTNDSFTIKLFEE